MKRDSISRSFMALLLLFVGAAPGHSARRLNVTDRAVRFMLIDSKVDAAISELMDGDTIDVAALGLSRPRFNIEADYLLADPNVGSVVFALDGWSGYETENTAPYLLCGKTRLGSPKRCAELDLGHHFVSMTALSEPNGGGEVLLNVTIRFEIVQAHCGVPQLVGSWEPVQKHPIPLAEAQGGMVGEDFVLIGGFSTEWNHASTMVYARNVKEQTSFWRRMDDIPSPVTHAATAVVGSKLFLCGGYVGGNPGPDSNLCFVFDHSNPPGSGQWSRLPDLPASRAGGGMIVDSKMNALFFSGGARRPLLNDRHAEDCAQTWMLYLDDFESGWVNSTDGLLNTNHIAHVTAKDHFGRERHYMMGGQSGEYEMDQNTNKLFEFDTVNEAWIERAPMLLTRGHATASTRATGCGFITAGGTSNEYGKISDISYYDIPTNTWHSIGNLPRAINTPVCDIHGGYLYCNSGIIKGKFSFRIQISNSLQMF